VTGFFVGRWNFPISALFQLRTGREFFLFGASSSLWDRRLIRRPAKDARSEDMNRPRPGYKQSDAERAKQFALAIAWQANNFPESPGSFMPADQHLGFDDYQGVPSCIGETRA
jgi:hypothetical protein